MPTDPLTLSILLVLASLGVLVLLFRAARATERRRKLASRCRLVCGLATHSGTSSHVRICSAFSSGVCRFPACKMEKK